MGGSEKDLTHEAIKSKFYDKLRKLKDDVGAKYEQLEERMNNLKDEVRKAQAVYGNVEAIRKYMEALDLHEISAQFTDVKEYVDGVLVRQEGSLDGIKTDLENFSEVFDEKIEEIKKIYKVALKDNKAELDELNKRLDDFSAGIATKLEELKTSYTDEIKGIKDGVGELENRIREREQIEIPKQIDESQLRKDIDKKLSAQDEKYEKIMQSCVESVEGVKEQIADLERKISTAPIIEEEELNRKIAEFEILHSKLETQTDKADKLLRKLEAATEKEESPFARKARTGH